MYTDTDSAVTDVLRLAQSMSYKAVLAGLPFGGGKAVILLPHDLQHDPQRSRRALFAAFGRFVDSLGGRYITAVDAGTRLVDLDEVARHTRYVCGTARDGLNPSPMTALGVFNGIRAAVRHRFGRDELKGMPIAIQGLGEVGAGVARLLRMAGARLTVTDIDSHRLAKRAAMLQATPVEPEQIYDQPCDVLVPCALGSVLNADTIPRLRCAIVAGAANNQLATAQDAERLHEHGILYAPDYVINAGGLIQVALGYRGAPATEIRQRTEALYHRLLDLFTRAASDNCSPAQLAEAMARAELRQAA